jgi:hypothetical protein
MPGQLPLPHSNSEYYGEQAPRVSCGILRPCKAGRPPEQLAERGLQEACVIGEIAYVCGAVGAHLRQLSWDNEGIEQLLKCYVVVTS